MKNKFTELTITIVTDDEHKSGDNLEMTRQRIEKAALYVHSLFNSIRYSLENLPSSDDRKIEETVWDARSVCEIGYGVADSILASASCLTEFIPDEKAETNLDSLAVQLSQVLNNSDLPEGIFNALQAALNDVYNEADSKAKNEFESSPEYLKAVFSAYQAREATNE